MPRLAGRIALVTGASRGIGAAVAKRLAAEGAHVVLVARTVGGLEAVDDEIEAAGGTATLVPLDLAEHDAIDRLGAALYERYGRLDILVGNAAILGSLSPLGHFEPALWQEVMAINLTANWRLIRSMDPLLRQAEAGRAIFVTSGAAKAALPYWGAYAASKAALEAMVRVYAGEVGNITKLRVNLIDPGIVRTALRAQAFPGENPASLASPENVAPAFIELALPQCEKNGELLRLS
jgi:NAD(P)-dependent dehydrogenase (short-subunit alcohol dehydrogenase family)